MKSPATLILASSSPRRRELLRRAGRSFRIVVPDIEEEPRSGEAPAAFARRAAREKAEAVALRLPERAARRRVILASDTIVVLGRRILGKPRHAADARRMLRSLSGRDHRVLSGLCVLRETGRGRWRGVTRVVATTVHFRPLSTADVTAYLRTDEPVDKAGAYGIQGAAAGFVTAIRGSYTNVVGLPLAETLALLGRAGK